MHQNVFKNEPVTNLTDAQITVNRWIGAHKMKHKRLVPVHIKTCSGGIRPFDLHLGARSMFHTPSALSTGKGPQGTDWTGVRASPKGVMFVSQPRLLPLLGFEPRTIQPVVLYPGIHKPKQRTDLRYRDCLEYGSQNRIFHSGNAMVASRAIAKRD